MELLRGLAGAASPHFGYLWSCKCFGRTFPFIENGAFFGGFLHGRLPTHQPGIRHPWNR